MSALIFSGTVKVDLQGSGVLRFTGVDRDRAEYTLTGFNQPRIALIDQRPSGLAAILQYLDSGRGEAFAAQFNAPADITISFKELHMVSVELYPPIGAAPKHVLSLSLLARPSEDQPAGSPPLQAQHCLFSQSSVLKDGRTACLALYRLPTHIPFPLEVIKTIITNGTNKYRITRI